MDSLDQSGLIKVEKIFLREMDRSFLAFVEKTEFILESGCTFKGFNHLLVFFIYRGGQGACCAVPLA
jgi:hypothetical protein